MSGAPNAIRAFFDGRVDEWDTARYTDETYVSRGRVALGWLRRLGRGKRVLDVGCGTGRQAVGALRAGDRVVAMDFSFPMAKATRDRVLREAPGAPAAVIVADAQHLPFRAGAFDAAVALGVVGFVPDRARMVREARRVLAPAGTLVCDVGVPEERVLFHALGRAAAAPVRALAARLRRRRGADAAAPVGWYKRNFVKHAPAEIEALLAAGGFRPVARGAAGFGELRGVPWRVQQWAARLLSALSVLPGGGPIARRGLTYLVRAERVPDPGPGAAPAPAHAHAPALRGELRG
ncbi:MAG TPA: class I SAM-dependent methyltransferase [Longimicrobium sp.]|nr:class I SAM-dependent methyltransferase [Longimicrobium sp.]